MKYFLYARKSSEAEDRQVMSVKSQIAELRKIAKTRKIKIVKFFKEEMSAKAPERPIYNKMIEEIRQGKADGIICWKINRLSRNPVDGGQISWLLQQGIIKHIITSDRDYRPEDNVLMISVELGMANQFILDLKKDTQRGLKNKLKMGWAPIHAPLGYLNDPISPQGKKKIFKDEANFNGVRQLWNMLLTGVYSVTKIADKARQMELRARRTNKALSNSTLYRMFTNIFYTGKYDYCGEILQGKHEPMITEEEFDRAQIILGDKGKPRAKTHSFAYTGLIRCGECGASITAEEKYKIQKNGNIHHYIYYRCTKKKGYCSQNAIRGKDLKKQILKFLEQIQISQKFKNWAIKYLREKHKTESGDQLLILQKHQRNHRQNQKQINNLLDLRLRDLIDDKAYKTKKKTLIEEQQEIEKNLGRLKERNRDWLELAEKTFKFASNTYNWFKKGSFDEKKIILQTIGSNLVLKDRILKIEPNKLFSLVYEPSKMNNWGG